MPARPPPSSKQEGAQQSRSFSCCRQSTDGITVEGTSPCASKTRTKPEGTQKKTPIFMFSIYISTARAFGRKLAF